MRHITIVVDSALARYAALPVKVKQSALPFALASLPILVSSLLGQYVVMPLVVALTAMLLYRITVITDKFMFTLSKGEALYSVTLPLCTFISVWGISLTLTGHYSMLNGVVGPYCLVLLFACAPAYRVNQLRTARRVPLPITFSIVGTLAVLAAVFHVTD